MNPDTITKLVDALTVIGTQLTIIAGAIGILGSAIASKAPKHWLITQLCARYFADTRNLRKPPVPNGPAETLKRVYRREDEVTPSESPAAKRQSDPPPPETWR